VADNTYDDAGRVTRIDYGNGAYETRTYDDANRMTKVQHYASGSTLLFEIEYAWTVNNWVDYRVERNYAVSPNTTTTVDFGYDHRGRLISESRTVSGSGSPEYSLTFTYDQLGNRQTLVDSVSGRQVEYVYDTDTLIGEMEPGASRNNRLLQFP
jgi:hypothetical protein